MTDTNKNELDAKKLSEVYYQAIGVYPSSTNDMAGFKAIQALITQQCKDTEYRVFEQAEAAHAKQIRKLHDIHEAELKQQCNQAKDDENARWKVVAEEIVTKDGVYRAVNYLNKRCQDLAQAKETERTHE